MNALEIAENQKNGTQYIDIKTDNKEMKEEVVIICKDENRKKKSVVVLFHNI
jgi:hypothetical protein